MTKSQQKLASIEQLSNQDGIISALAFDQRGALKRMMAEHQTEPPTVEQIEQLKVLVSEELTQYASSILLDPEYGLPASDARNKECGLLLAYEKTGYDVNAKGRLPDCLVEWSAKRLKEQGANAVKFLLYYDVDDSEEINIQKKAYIERIGSECVAEDIPFFLEVLTYDDNIPDNKSAEFAKVKPRKVNEAMKLFSEERFNVDVLKVEVPVNMNFVEGFTEGEVVYTKEEAAQHFRDQDAATHLPYIYLSAGVSAELFQDTLTFAHDAGAHFNGVLCGRATWSGAVKVYIEQGEQAAREWLRTTGYKNIDDMNREEVQLLGFEIVAYAGDARSKLLEALNAANEGDFEKAEQLTEEANECIANAHKAQTNLLAQEAQGDDIAFSITMIHGQDHLMTTLLLKDLMKHLIELYKKGS